MRVTLFKRKFRGRLVSPVIRDMLSQCRQANGEEYPEELSNFEEVRKCGGDPSTLMEKKYISAISFDAIQPKPFFLVTCQLDPGIVSGGVVRIPILFIRQNYW